MIPDDGSAIYRQRIVVMVDTDHQDRMTAVSLALTERGVVVEHVLEALGMITGTVPDATYVVLAAQVDGVASVEEELGYQIPPPDSPVQ